MIDLSHKIKATMPVYPDTPKPKIVKIFNVKDDGFCEHSLIIGSHTGTHVDAPAHMILNGKTLDEYALSDFTGRAVIIDCSDVIQDITMKKVSEYDDIIQENDIVIIKTGWEHYWEDEKYFHGFPTMTVQVAKYLVDKKIKGVGLDAISVDSCETNTYPIHHVLFEKGIYIIENLCHLDLFKQTVGELIAMPLLFDHSDGSPVRVGIREVT